MSEQPIYLEDKLAEVRDSGRLDFRAKALPTWCPGCGYFAMVDAVASAFHDLKIEKENAAVVSGIGCSSRFPFFLQSYGMHTLHGRALPVATGVKTANEDLTVVVVGGDGDGFAIGGGHIPHAAKRNVDITYLLFDNGVYGLTKGQTSPTSVQGFRTPTSPYDNPDVPLNPLLMLLAYGASWVGHAYAGRPDHLRHMIRLAMEHRGFSYLHIQSPCVTFDKTERTYSNLTVQVTDLPEDHDIHDRAAAMKMAMSGHPPPLGVYFSELRPTLGDALDGIAEKAGGLQPAKARA